MLDLKALHYSTGYRKYTYNQINYIDRVKYLQDFGLSLESIRSTLEKDSVDDLIFSLTKHRNDLQIQIDKIKEIQKDIDWYIDYYRHIDTDKFSKVPFKTNEEERWVFAEPFKKDESIYGTAGYRLTSKKNLSKYAGMKFLRKNGYLLDYEKLLKGEICPTHYFIYLKEKPQNEFEDVIQLHAGEYFCVRLRILSESFDNKYITEYFAEGIKPTPIVVADEYEDNFSDFKHCVYEVQIYMQ